MKINILIPKRNSTCSLGGESFKEGENYITHLLEEENLLKRSDYCEKCWKGVPKKISGHIWKGKIPLKQAPILNRSDSGIKLFQRLHESKEDSKLLYVLTQLLVRKKILFKVKNELYELMVTGEVFQVKNIVLKAEEVEAFASKLSTMMDL